MSERFVVLCQLRSKPGDEALFQGIEALGVQPLASGMFDSVEAASAHAHRIFPWLKDQLNVQIRPLTSFTQEEAYDVGYREGFDEGVSK